RTALRAEPAYRLAVTLRDARRTRSLLLSFALSFAAGAALMAGCSTKPTAQSAGSGGADGGSDGTGNGGSPGGAGRRAGVPCNTTGVSKGPWSFAIDGTSARLRWEACREGTVGDVVYAPETGGASMSAPSVESSFTTMTTYTAALAPSATPDYA